MVALLVIVLAILAGIAWWLFSSRSDAEKNARAFAEVIVQRVAVNYDEKFLHVHLSPEGQVNYLQSWRERLMIQLRELGVPAQPIEIKGNLEFNSYFFDPHGIYRAKLNYPTTSASLEVNVSRGMTVWQVDSVNLTWTPPAVLSPTPSPAPTATPTPAPMPAPTRKAKSKSKP